MVNYYIQAMSSYCWRNVLLWGESILQRVCFTPAMLYSFHSFLSREILTCQVTNWSNLPASRTWGVRMTCLCSSPTSVQVVSPDQQCLVLFSCKNQWKHRKANWGHTWVVLLKNQFYYFPLWNSQKLTLAESRGSLELSKVFCTTIFGNLCLVLVGSAAASGLREMQEKIRAWESPVSYISVAVSHK